MTRNGVSQNNRTKTNTRTTRAYNRNMANSTRVSGSGSSSSTTWVACLGRRHRSTAEGGRSDLVSVPRSRRRRTSRHDRVVVHSASLFSSFTRRRRHTPVDRCRWRRRVGSARPRPPVNSTQHTCSRLCTDVLLELSFRTSQLFEVNCRSD